MSTARARTFELTGADGGPLRGEVRTEGEELFRAANRPEVELSVVEGGDHLFGLHEGQKNAPPHLESAVDRTLAWFSRYLY